MGLGVCSFSLEARAVWTRRNKRIVPRGVWGVVSCLFWGGGAGEERGGKYTVTGDIEELLEILVFFCVFLDCLYVEN